MSVNTPLKYLSIPSLFTFIVSLVWSATPEITPGSMEKGKREMRKLLIAPPDSTDQDTAKKLPFPIQDRKPYERGTKRHPFDLSEPSNIKNKYELNDEGTGYNYTSKIGNSDYRLPASSSVKQLLNEENKRQNEAYFRQRSQAQNFASGSGIIPQLRVGPKIFDKIFGSGVIDIRPRGTAEITFAGNFNTVRNPALAPKQQTTGQFDFRQKIQLNVQGSIGDRMKVNINYDTEAAFDFENQVKLDYAGKEDDIIKKIELGNVTLPLSSTLIQGSQSLFGVKTTLQFGKLTMTSVVSQQRGKTTETELTGGSQTSRFDIQADGYDANRHYFLSQYFRDNYNRWLSNLPIIGSSIVINRVEVWVTNRTGAFDNSRDVLGFSDLGEGNKRDNKFWTVNVDPRFPFDTVADNNTNSLYAYLTGATTLNNDTAKLRSSFQVQNELAKDAPVTGLQPISQYQIINYARQLTQNEFTFNPRLGYISLTQALNNDDILCVAYEYTNTATGLTYRVGEFSSGTGPGSVPPNPTTPNVLFLKMLKGPSLRPDLPMWDLMMKNVYSLGTFNIQQKDFKLNVIYADDPSGADLNYIPVQNEPLLTGVPLLTVLNLDNLNTQLERAPDGIFDFIEGVTIQSQQGRIIFPVLEPFGSDLAPKFRNDPSRARYYSFYELYDSTRFAAVQLPQYNKFFLRGTYQGSSNSEISIGQTNIPRGSVKVTANGAPLTENQDYTVDYNLGRVRIINTGLLNSGAVIKVSAESNSLFSVQQKTLMGSRFDYKYNNNLILGGTLMYLTERPLTPKVNIGEEPLSNLMIGVDGTFKKDSRFLTKLVDRLPFIETKEPSNVVISGEYARLIPGVQGALAQNGTAYLDDFEGSETPFDVRMGNNWVLASTPQGQPDLFPEASGVDRLDYGFNRANLAWYSVATTFTNENDPYRPTHIKNDPDQLSSHCVRAIDQHEVYPNKQIQAGLPTLLPTFDLSFTPTERGPYNYNVDGLNTDGTLKNPRDKWGGIMRKIDQNDFEAANIDYIEIWMMDPYLCNNATSNGQLYINLGNISEDVLHDNRRAAENGLPRDITEIDVDTTSWGRVPRKPVINFAFDADPNIRKVQDVGLDGFDDDAERAYFDTSYLQRIANAPGLGTGSVAYQNAQQDPSNDNYHYYLGSDYDASATSILDRYKKFNKHQGNSPTIEQSPEKNYPTTATNIPDNEDINRDYTLNEIEEYYQYKIDISKDKFFVGQNYITDSSTTSVKLVNGTSQVVTWYQFKVPIHEFEKKVGQIIDFKSIRFMRVYMRGFQENMTLRFAAMNMVRADWRKYLGNLEAGKENKPGDPEDDTRFVVSTVNIEKTKSPVEYKVPPGISREIDFSSPQAIQQNEQSLSLNLCNLKDGDARAVFKNTRIDLRQYGKLRMFMHAHANGTEPLHDGELTAFIRLGTDLTNNYYEFEMPLKVTPASYNDDRSVWPLENEMAITLEEFINTKIQRTNANYPFTVPYVRVEGSTKYTVIGLPDLSNVKVVMLGVRNPKTVPGNGDDGLAKCGEVWFNELRMTDFNNRGGWAATGRIQTKLADFGNMQLTGSVSTVGFGGIDKKLSERSFNDQYNYDLQTSFELGKFFPKNSGLSVPMFFSYGNTLIRPFYDPLNPDTKLQKELDETTDPERKERISRAADDFTARKGFNFTNVRKNRVNTTKKAQPYDISNFSFTYSFTETYRRNQTIEYYILQNYKTQILYTYNFTAKPLEPFSKIKSKNLGLIKDFNVFYLPQSWGFRVETERRYGETVNRNNDNAATIIQPLYDKLYTMTRYYEFRYNLSRGLTFDYNATVQARIDEPLGKIDESTPDKRDTIWDNLWKGGRTTQFDQTARLNYDIPVKKLPFFDWVSQSTYSYTANYQWKQAPPAADSLGNKISNSRVQSWNFNFNMTQLYNKVPFLREINNPGQKKMKKVKAKDDKKNPKDKDKKGPKEEDKVIEVTPEKKSPIVVNTMKFLMMLKNVTFSNTINEGMMLPGFNPRPSYFGENYDANGPGFEFLAGMQDPNFRYKAAENGWLSKDPRITDFYMKDYRENFTGKATLEPITDLRIELSVSKSRSLATTSLFKYDTTEGVERFRDMTPPTESGTYSITYNVWPTAFAGENSEGVSSVFQRFEENRIMIANRLAEENAANKPSLGRDANGFPIGYSRSSQDVLIPAFLAAYGGTDPNKVSLTPFPKIPMPNWRASYSGLSKIEAIKEYASNITLNHQYSSTYNVGSFISTWDSTGSRSAQTGDYASQYQIKQISVVERWGPFLGIDITFVNNVTTKVEYKRDRTLNFSLSNQQLSEQTGSEFVFGFGWRTNKLTLPFRIGGRKRVLENDINFRLDFSIRDQLTKVRNLDRESNDPVLGQTVTSIKPTIDYTINEKLMLRIFYDRRATTPATSTSFPTVIQSGGFTLRYTIQ